MCAALLSYRSTYGRRADLDDLLLILKERIEHAPEPLLDGCSFDTSSPVADAPSFAKSLLLSLFALLPFHSKDGNPSDQDYNTQEQSALLCILPFEIRRMIWQHTLGVKLLHITRAKKRLLAIECPAICRVRAHNRGFGCWGLTSRNTEFFPGHYLRPHPQSKAKPANLLFLPRTCRMM